MIPPDASRRRLLLGMGSGLMLAGCDKLNSAPAFRSVLKGAESLQYRTQRLVGGKALATEFDASDRSPIFRANGTRMPEGEAYQKHLANGFADWRLEIAGLVTRPLSLSLAALQSLPQRTQITRHDCVEGWSAIAQWTGPQLGRLLRAAGLRPEANFIVFHCADTIGGRPYYESIDLNDAFHPQTILAHRINGAPLPVQNGAPLRLRVERQLGYKHAKYVMRIEARTRLDDLYGGKGGYWEDRSDYQWFAGI